MLIKGAHLRRINSATEAKPAYRQAGQGTKVHHKKMQLPKALHFKILILDTNI
jgi:hypothetical protein